jgi:hypothetical protein
VILYVIRFESITLNPNELRPPAAMDSNTDGFTSTVFNSAFIEFKDEHDFRSVYAGRNITKGHLLMVEQVLEGTTPQLISALQADESLFNQLYPRTTPWKVFDVGGLQIEASTNKLKCNCFRGDRDDYHLIGRFTSMFNHSNDPNAATVCYNFKFENEACAKFLCTWAIKDITKGDSIDIHYTMTVGGPHTFITPHEYVKPDVPGSISMLVERILQNYHEKNTRKMIRTTVRQMLVHHGVYWSSSNAIQVTSRFRDEFESLFGCPFAHKTDLAKFIWVLQQKAFPGTPFAFN